MATRHKLGTSSPFLALSPPGLGRSRPHSDHFAHLFGMETDNTQREAFEPVFSLSELATRLRVSVQTIYDLRSQGRGPRGFRVGRELRFRASEVDAWLARMEDAEAARHRPGEVHS
jgi:excisionase family DNA binding protein